ncbi:MAG: hypothetical protein N2Z79_03520, partial [Candidatus Omnitrophica bacterium]|nr:hypothetical protein [Candidatus Omnitrophota bacterium]
MSRVYIVLHNWLSKYSFEDHPFNSQRYLVFKKALEERGLLNRLGKVIPRLATEEELKSAFEEVNALNEDLKHKTQVLEENILALQKA